MSSIANSASTYPATTEPKAEWPILLRIASAVALLHILANGRYGFHRDELQFLSDARHLDWGFVCYPPLTPFLEHIGLALFGVSLVGLRLFSVITQSAVIVVAGLIAKELGGSRLAQATAALAVALSPLPLFEGTEFQYSSFDYLWWVLAAYFVVRLLKSEDPRWWLAIGVTVGIGLLTKYSIVFYIAGILAGVVLTSARRYLASIWFWSGIAIALLIFLPNFLWLVRHDFISYQFLQHIHTRDVGQGRVAPLDPSFSLVAVAVGVDLPCVVVALGRVAHRPGLAQDDDPDDHHGKGPAEPVLPRLQQGHVEVVGDEGEEPHRLHPRGPGGKALKQRARAAVVMHAGGLVPVDRHVELPDAFHRPGDGVVDAGLRRGDRLGVLGDFVEVRLDVLDQALGLVEGMVGLLLEPAGELLLAVGDEGGGQLVVQDGRGLPVIAGGAETLMLFDGRAGEQSERI